MAEKLEKVVVKLPYKTAMSNFNIAASNSGDSKRNTFKFEYSEELGCPVKVVTGSINFQDYINASKDSTDINAIVERYNNGNTAVLNVSNGVYADVSALPNNMQDYSKFCDNVIGQFYEMDPEIKALFNNDANDFIKAAVNGSVNSILNNYYKEKVAAFKDGDNNVKTNS